MTLELAKELAKNEMDKANVVVVTSDKAIYLLKEIAEIEVIKTHADLNKLEMFVVKPSEELTSEEVVIEKPKKKK
jgi:hypothetical protein